MLKPDQTTITQSMGTELNLFFIERMKEELIKELVANSKFSNRVNVEYQQRIESLQKDLNLARAELVDMQSLMQQVSVKDHVEKSKLEK
jgi:hypothetical protein